MSGKLEFGVDYLWIMRNLVFVGSPKDNMDPAADAAARFFLLQWGFTIEEIDRVNEVFWERFNNQKLENDLYVVAKRISDHIIDDSESINRFVIGLAAIGFIDFNVTDEEGDYVRWFQNILDLKPSEFTKLCMKGYEWSVALNYFAKEYARSRYGVKVE